MEEEWQIISKKLNKSSIFLIDAFGAFLSSLSLGLVLPIYQDRIGMPKVILLALAGVALLLMFYSLCCFKFANHNRPIWLKLVIYANLTYCFFTAKIVVYHINGMTTLGLIYFILEIFIILLLVFYELKIYKELKK